MNISRQAASKVKMDYGEHGREANGGRGQYRLALDLFKAVSLEPGLRILDVGAGMGELAIMLRERGFKVVCVEGAKHCYESLMKSKLEAYKVDLEKENLPFPDKSFDIVFSLEAIEHLWEVKHYLSEIRRVLKDDGYAVLTTPNYNNWKYRILSLLGRPDQFTYKSRHKKFYTARSFLKELDSCFFIETARGLGWIPWLKIVFVHSSFVNLLSFTVGALVRPKK